MLFYMLQFLNVHFSILMEKYLSSETAYYCVSLSQGYTFMTLFFMTFLDRRVAYYEEISDCYATQTQFLW